MKILYAGSPDISVIPLRHLVEENNHQLVGVLTNPPSSQGRSKTPIATPVAQYAQGIGIPVLEPEKLTAEVREAVAQLQPDILVCFAYGKIFGPKFMALFPQGGINIHPSLLPKYRGCAPVPAAILNQESETGVSIQRIAQEMDTGNILCQKVISLNGTENSQTLLEKASFLGAEMVAEVLENISCGKVTEIEQDNSPRPQPRMPKPCVRRMRACFLQRIRGNGLQGKPLPFSTAQRSSHCGAYGSP